MKEKLEKINSVLKPLGGKIEEFNQEQGIITIDFGFGTIDEHVDASEKVIKEMPDCAAVQFDFNGKIISMTPDMSKEEVLKTFQGHCNAARIEHEIDVIVENKDQVAKGFPRFGTIINMPEVAEAQEKYETIKVKAQEKRDEALPLREEIERLKKKLAEMESEASKMENDARKQFGGLVGDLIRKSLDKEVDAKVEASVARWKASQANKVQNEEEPKQFGE